MINVNIYLAKQYPSPPCWELVSDIYASELSDVVTEYKTINASIRTIANMFRIALHKSAHGFCQIAAPVENCIVLLGKTARMGLHHCGVFIDGKVLHALESGNYYEEMSVIEDQYALIEYWAKP